MKEGIGFQSLAYADTIGTHYSGKFNKEYGRLMNIFYYLLTFPLEFEWCDYSKTVLLYLVLLGSAEADRIYGKISAYRVMSQINLWHHEFNNWILPLCIVNHCSSALYHAGFPSKQTVQRLIPLIGSLLSGWKSAAVQFGWREGPHTLPWQWRRVGFRTTWQHGTVSAHDPMCQCCTLLSKSTVNHRLGCDQKGHMLENINPQRAVLWVDSKVFFYRFEV